MKKISILSLFFFGAMSLACYSQPKLEIVGGDTYNWGDVSPKQSPLKAEIIFKNVGTDTLQIPNVKPGCGCTTPFLSKKVILPNDTAKLRIELNVLGTQGAVNKSVTITTNEANNTRYLFLKANVIVPLLISPQKWFTFTQIKVGQEAKSSVKFRNNTSKTIVINEVNCTPKTLFCDLKPGTKIAPNQELDVTATVTAEKPGQFSGNVEVKTDNPECDSNLQAFGNVEESPVFNPKN